VISQPWFCKRLTMRIPIVPSMLKGIKLAEGSRAQARFSLRIATDNALTFFGIGVVGVVAGVVLFLVSDSDDAPKTALTPFFNGSQLGVVGHF
jgi:hypothetical protein